MGAKTWMLVYADSNARQALGAKPRLDRAATLALAQRLFPDERLDALEDGDLSWTSPPDQELHIGCFPGVSVVAAREFGIDNPSRLAEHFIAAGSRGTIALHAMHSVVNWFAYALWVDGRLTRSLSLSPDSGIIEDIGTRQPFELPYWAGERSACDSEEEAEAEPFPFDPLDLGEEALRALFGYQLEGLVDGALLDPASIPLLRFRRRRRRWWPRR